MYEVVVIGNDLSARIAALTCRKRGMATLLIRDGNQPYLHCPPGYSFPLDPLPPLGLGPGQVVERFFKQIGLEISALLPQAGDSGPLLQIIMPQNRLEVTPDPEFLAEEFHREFPRLGRKQKKFYLAAKNGNDLIDRLTGDFSLESPDLGQVFFGLRNKIMTGVAWRAKSAALGSLIRQERLLKHVVAGLGLISSYQNITSLAQPASAYALALPFRATVCPSLGRAELLGIIDDVSGNGSLNCDRASVIRIRARQEITLDLTIDDAVEVIKTKKLIISANWEKLNLLLGQGPFSPPAKHLRQIEPTLYPFTIHLGIRAQAVPEKLAPYAIVKNGPTDNPESQELIFLAISREGDRRRAPPGQRALSVTIFCQEPPWRMMTEELKEKALAILTSLNFHLPFLLQNIEYFDLDQSIALAKRNREMISLRYEIKHVFFAGLGMQPHQTSHPGIFLTGGMLCAGLGYEGEVLSGLIAANLVVAS